MKYLLPCPQCGELHPVDSTQAGEQIPCTCGRKVEVPSLRGLRDLQRAGAPSATRVTTAPPVARAGEIVRRLAYVLGLVLLALGLLVAAYGAVIRVQIRVPTRPIEDIERADAAIDALTPEDAHKLWSTYRTEGLGPYHEPVHHFGQRVQTFYTRILLGGLGIAALGLLTATGALLVRTRHQSRTT